MLTALQLVKSYESNIGIVAIFSISYSSALDILICLHSLELPYTVCSLTMDRITTNKLLTSYISFIFSYEKHYSDFLYEKSGYKGVELRP